METSLRICSLTVTVIAAAALSACAMSPKPMMASQDSLPEAVRVPMGHSVAMETVGSGELTYECRAKAAMPSEYEWVFIGPNATLKNRMGTAVGKYYGPPATWEAMDGSKITATQLAVAPAGTGNIPYQLVKANPAMGTGAMSGISHVQRVATRGGAAPGMACSTATSGQRQVVSYQADYIFWKAM